MAFWKVSNPSPFGTRKGPDQPLCLRGRGGTGGGALLLHAICLPGADRFRFKLATVSKGNLHRQRQQTSDSGVRKNHQGALFVRAASGGCRVEHDAGLGGPLAGALGHLGVSALLFCPETRDKSHTPISLPKRLRVQSGGGLCCPACPSRGSAASSQQLEAACLAAGGRGCWGCGEG